MLRLKLILCSVAAATAAYAYPPASTTPEPFQSVPGSAVREQTADQQVRQALDRLGFGARPGDYQRVRAMGVDRWIARQLEPRSIDDSRMDSVLAHFPTLAMSPAELFQAYPSPQSVRATQRARAARTGRRTGAGGTGQPTFARSPTDSQAVAFARRQSRRILGDLQAAKMARAVASNRQLEDVMVDFWENHFNVFAGKGPERYYLASYEREAIRPNALGHFRDLLEAVAKSPAMLYYLDNWQSSVDSGRPVLAGCGTAERRTARGQPTRGGRRLACPNESRSPRAGRASPLASRIPRPAARRPRRGINENYGRELMELHTLGVNGGYTQQDVINVARALTGWTVKAPRQGGGFIFRPRMHDAGSKVVLGHALPAGRGIEDGEEVLDILARHPSTAHFISMELVRRFVSDSPPPALVDRAAQTFTRTDGDIREVLRTIFTSPEFFSRATYKAKVKTPFELVASALRAVGAEPDTTPRTAQIVAQLGEPLYLHRDPNGYPETGDAWINTGTILDRINFGLSMTRGRIPGVSVERWAHTSGIATATHAKQVDAVIQDILGGEASPDTRKVLESGRNPLVAGCPAGCAMRDAGSGTTSGDRPVSQRAGRIPHSASRLSLLLGLALGAPEFQRR